MENPNHSQRPGVPSVGALVIPGGGILSTSTAERIADIAADAEQYRKASKAPRTLESYTSDWRGFHQWVGETVPEVPIPADPEHLTAEVPLWLVVAYITDRAGNGLAPSSVARHLSAIRYWHHQARLPSPTDHPDIAETLAGIKRSSVHDTRQVRPLYLEDVAAAVETLGDDPKAVRDRAVLLVGWWGAFRRSELVALDRGDIEEHPEGMLLTIRRSKTDQEGKGRQIPLHYHANGTDPVRALRGWLELFDGDVGPVFRRVDRWGNVRPERLHHSAVAVIVKDAARRIGIDPGTVSGHSLRAGFVSECDRRRIPSGAVRQVTGHQSDAMLSIYSRPGDLFDSSAGAYFDNMKQG